MFKPGPIVVVGMAVTFDLPMLTFDLPLLTFDLPMLTIDLPGAFFFSAEISVSFRPPKGLIYDLALAKNMAK